MPAYLFVPTIVLKPTKLDTMMFDCNNERYVKLQIVKVDYINGYNWQTGKWIICFKSRALGGEGEGEIHLWQSDLSWIFIH